MRLAGRTFMLMTSLLLVSGVASCAMFGRGGDRQANRQDRFVRPGLPRTSPSGGFTASFQDGPAQNGVDTWIVVITDKGGQEVFRDPLPYSSRHGVGVTWLSDTSRDQLWILSSDVGWAYVEIDPNAPGRPWVKTTITPHNRSSVPAEIAELG